MPLDYKTSHDRAARTRQRGLNLVEQVTTALRAEVDVNDEGEAAQVEQICNAVDAATAGLVYLGDSLREIAAAIHDHA
jgi:hypothetical protein